MEGNDQWESSRDVRLIDPDKGTFPAESDPGADERPVRPTAFELRLVCPRNNARELPAVCRISHLVIHTRPAWRYELGG